MEYLQQKVMEDSPATLTGYLHELSKEQPHRGARPCVLVCPGGGYEFCSDREADPVALFYFARGYNVFILRYSVTSAGGPALCLQPLREISCAVATLRENAQKWRIEPQKIAVCGFSAGGHLCASLGTLWNAPRLNAPLDFRGENRPNAMILGYPVISTRPWAGAATSCTAGTLAGNDPDWVDFFATDEHVGPHTPPAFIWATTDDGTVASINSRRFAEVLTAAGIENELHIFAHGNHGYSMATAEVDAVPVLKANPHIAHWAPLSAEWLDTLFDWQE